MEYYFSQDTDTIRFMPANYLIATRINGRWSIDCDTAVDNRIAVLAFLTIHGHHHIRYGSGEELQRVLNTLAGCNDE